MSNPEVLDPEIDDPDSESSGLARFRHPAIPITVNELATLKGEAIEILEARIQILDTARMRGIRMTHPEDWVLFKSPDDRITGYLQDAGCDRLRDITGIEVFNVSTPERVVAADGQSYMYLVRGSGRSRLTLQVVEEMEGGRESTEDFCKDKKGAAQELAVRKAARANLDGNITRELAGLKTVPLDELKKAWEGTNKNWENCRRGRGFGSRDERLGGRAEAVPDVDPPVCPHCNTPGVYRQAKGTRGAFYGCKNYEKHADKKFLVDAAKWIADHAPKAADKATTTPATGSAPAAAQDTHDDEPPPPSGDDIFGSKRR